MPRKRLGFEEQAAATVQQAKAHAWALEEVKAVRTRAAEALPTNGDAQRGLASLARMLTVPRKRTTEKADAPAPRRSRRGEPEAAPE